jgi:hypothetical protein
MAGYRIETLLSHNIMSPLANTFGSTVWLSKLVAYQGEKHVLMVLRNGATITGTSAGVTAELDASTALGGGSMSQTGGGAMTKLSVVGGQTIMLGTTDAGGFTAIGSTTTWLQCKLTFGNNDNVATDISVDLIFLN